jgi:Rieske Fe-S protein
VCDENGIAQVETAPANPGRRGFFAAVIGLFVAMVTLPSRRAHAKKVAVDIGKIEALKKVGGSSLIKIKEQKVLLIRDTDKTVRAINPICTHKNCTVKFSSETMKMHCPCHKSAYDLDGRVLDGPAPKPLSRFPAALEGEQLVMTLPDVEEAK